MPNSTPRIIQPPSMDAERMRLDKRLWPCVSSDVPLGEGGASTMTKLHEIEPVFVACAPDNMEEGKLYISLGARWGGQLCPCGCRKEVMISFMRGNHSLLWDNGTVTLIPSVGNSALPCRSHYFIERNKVKWCEPLPKRVVATTGCRPHGTHRGDVLSHPIPAGTPNGAPRAGPRRCGAASSTWRLPWRR